MARQVQIKKNEIPEGWSLEAADFINKVELCSARVEMINLFFVYSWSKESHCTDLVWMDRLRSKITHGYEITLGINLTTKK